MEKEQVMRIKFGCAGLPLRYQISFLIQGYHILTLYNFVSAMAANTRHPQHSSQSMGYAHPSTYLNMASTSTASPLGAGRVGLIPGGPGHGGDVMITVTSRCGWCE